VYSAYYAAKDSVFTEGDSSLVRLICDVSGETPVWRFATDFEKDVAALGAADDSAVRRGSVDNANVYVMEDGWRRGTELDIEDGLGACIQDRVDSIRHKTGAADTTGWYKCVTDEDVYADGKKIPSVWRKASTYEADLPYWNSLYKSAMHSYGDSVGLLMVGPYSGLTMVWDNATDRRGALRQATEFEIQQGITDVRLGLPLLVNLIMFRRSQKQMHSLFAA